jgi:uncharacterized membrane protein
MMKLIIYNFRKLHITFLQIDKTSHLLISFLDKLIKDKKYPPLQRIGMLSIQFYLIHKTIFIILIYIICYLKKQI